MSTTQTLQFSFGPAGHKAPSGYTAVATDAYAAALGYGWDSAAALYTGSNHAAGTPALAATFDYGVNRTFGVDLPNGSYQVTLTLENSLSKDTNYVHVILNGTYVATSLAVGAGQILSPTYLVTVTNGRLNVQLVTASGYRYWSLSALALTAAVSPAQSQASAGPDQTVLVGNVVTFAGSVLGGTAPYVLGWDFGDAATLTPTHVYATPGTYHATLTVTDGRGLQSTSMTTITVNPVPPPPPPVAPPTVTLSAPATGTVGTALSFSATATSPDPAVQAAGFTYQWAFGDRTTGASANPTHTYTSAGSYTVAVTATDSTGQTSPPATATTTIAAVAPPPPPPPPTGTVNIDAAWLQPQGSGPYLLTQAGTAYVLQSDVTVPGTAFVVMNKSITLDLNGHTITYDHTPPLTVPNGGFETGDLTGWDTSKAPGAKVVPAITGMWGKWVLQLPTVSGTQAIVSQPVTIPQANVEYTAAITPRCGNYQTTVTLAIVDAVNGAVLATGASDNPNAGFSALARFVPLTLNPVKLQVTVTVPSGQTDYVFLDYAALTTSRQYGVVASPDSWYFPAALAKVVGTNPIDVTGFVLKNGSIAQGQAHGCASFPIHIADSNQVTIDHVQAQASGLDTHIIYGPWAKNVTLTGNTLTGQLDRVSNRMAIVAQMKLENAGGTNTVRGNTLTGTGQAGLHLTGGVGASVIGNTITMKSLVTDGYALFFVDLQNFEIAGNTVNQVSGRGLIFDSYNGSTNFVLNGTVHDNTIQVQEGANLEYGVAGMEATALRMRNLSAVQKNITFTNNSFIATTGAGLDWAAIGARLTEGNASGAMTNANLVFRNNLFKAIVTAPDPSLSGGSNASNASALSLSGIDAGTGLTLSNNTLESNCVSLAIGDNDSWSRTNQDVLFLGNTLKKSADGAVLPYTAVVAGNWDNGVHAIRLIDMQYANGATPGVFFANAMDVGVQQKDVATGYRLSVTAVDAQAQPVVGATVQGLDPSGKTVFTGTTDSQGQVVDIPVVTTTLSQSGTNPMTTTTQNTFTVSVTRGTQTLKQTVTVTGNQTVKFQF